MMDATRYWVEETPVRAGSLTVPLRNIWAVRAKVGNGWELAVFLGTERQCRAVLKTLNELEA